MNSYDVLMIMLYMFGGACMAYLLTVGLVILKIQVAEFIREMRE